MEMEVPAVPKAVLENLLTGMRGPESEYCNLFRHLPAPLFHGAALQPLASAVPLKASASSGLPLQGGCLKKDLDANSQNLFKERPIAFAKDGNVSLPPVKEKPKRVRKSRAAVLYDNGGSLDRVINVEVVQQPQIHSAKRRRSSSKLVGDCGTAEKPPPRKRNRSKTKAKEEQLLSFSATEMGFGFSDSTSNNGNLGIFGLESKALDLPCHMKGISEDSVMPGDFRLPFVYGKNSPQLNSALKNSVVTNVSSVLQNLTRTVNMDQAQSHPFDVGEDGLSIGLCHPNFKSRNVHEESSMGFGLMNVQGPSSNFWNKSQLQPTISLASLIAQPSLSTDSRFFPLEVPSNSGKLDDLPPSILTLGSLYIRDDNSGDLLASSKANQWFRAEPHKKEFGETHNSNAFSQGNMLSFKLDGSDSLLKPSKTCMSKEGLLDIDLNKQSPEAEAAETIGGSACTVLCNPHVSNKAPVVAETKVNISSVGSCKAPDNQVAAATVNEAVENPESLQISARVNTPFSMSEKESMHDIKALPNSQNFEQKLDVSVTLQQNNEVPTEVLNEESVIGTGKGQQGIEQVKNAIANASSTLPSLVVPEVVDTAEPCSTDVPYSPGMLATAQILCEMANSSRSFYVEGGENNACSIERHDGAYIQHPAKVARLSGLAEKEMVRTRKHMVLHKGSSEVDDTRAQSRDGKDKLLPGHFINRKGPTTEPWALTPPRHTPRNIGSRMSGSQSSESDRSPCCNRKVSGAQDDLGRSKRLQKEQHAGSRAPVKASNIFKSKDSKGNRRPSPKVTFLKSLPSKGLPSLTSLKKRVQAETKQALMAYGDGLAKVSRPRSSAGKNCSQLQRFSDIYSIQNGCSYKSPSKSQQVLSHGDGVRHGSK